MMFSISADAAAGGWLVYLHKSHRRRPIAYKTTPPAVENVRPRRMKCISSPAVTIQNTNLGKAATTEYGARCLTTKDL